MLKNDDSTEAVFINLIFFEKSTQYFFQRVHVSLKKIFKFRLQHLTSLYLWRVDAFSHVKLNSYKF